MDGIIIIINLISEIIMIINLEIIFIKQGITIIFKGIITILTSEEIVMKIKYI